MWGESDTLACMGLPLKQQFPSLLMSCADHSPFWCPLQPGPGSLNLPRWGGGWLPAPSAAPSASSAWPAATPGLTSPGWRTTSPSLLRRLGRTRRRSGRWTWRTWSQRTVGNTPAGCLTKSGKSTRRTKSKWSVSAALGGRAQRGLWEGGWASQDSVVARVQCWWLDVEMGKC